MDLRGNIARGLFILCLPVLLVTASIAMAINSSWLYNRGIEKYSLAQVESRGLAKSEVDKAVRGLISYFNSAERYISVTVMKDGKLVRLFNDREVTHLKDVKDLIWLDYRVLLGTLVYVLLYVGILLWRRKARRLAWDVVGGSSLTLALMLALGLGTLFGFDQLFLQFHLISFTNEFWQLDPATDYLIMLFPQEFWADAFLFVALGALIGTVVLGLAAGGHLFFRRQRVRP